MGNRILKSTIQSVLSGLKMTSVTLKNDVNNGSCEDWIWIILTQRLYEQFEKSFRSGYVSCRGKVRNLLISILAWTEQWCLFPFSLASLAWNPNHGSFILLRALCSMRSSTFLVAVSICGEVLRLNGCIWNKTLEELEPDTFPSIFHLLAMDLKSYLLFMHI